MISFSVFILKPVSCNVLHKKLYIWWPSSCTVDSRLECKISMYMIKLPLITCLNLILTRPEFISVFSSFSILGFSSSFISSRTRHIVITINIRDTTLDMDWSYVSINNFSWSVLKHYNETMSSWTLMWFESMVCCVWFFFLLVFFFSFFSVFFVLFLFLFVWVHLVSCVCSWFPTHIVVCFCFVCLRLIFCVA